MVHIKPQKGARGALTRNSYLMERYLDQKEEVCKQMYNKLNWLDKIESSDSFHEKVQVQACKVLNNW